MDKTIIKLWYFLAFGVISLGAILLLHNYYPSYGNLAKKNAVTLESGVSPKILGLKLSFKIDMKEPMEMHTSGSRSLNSPVGSSSVVDKNIVFYQEEKLISINSNGFAIRFIINWRPVSKHEGSQVTNEGNQLTNTVLFNFGRVTQTNISGLTVIGQYED